MIRPKIHINRDCSHHSIIHLMETWLITCALFQQQWRPRPFYNPLFQLIHGNIHIFGNTLLGPLNDNPNHSECHPLQWYDLKFHFNRYRSHSPIGLMMECDQLHVRTKWIGMGFHCGAHIEIIWTIQDESHTRNGYMIKFRIYRSGPPSNWAHDWLFLYDIILKMRFWYKEKTERVTFPLSQPSKYLFHLTK